MEGEKSVPLESENDEISTSSSVSAARLVQIRLENVPTSSTAESLPPLSPSPSLSESTSIARTLRSTISPISPYFQVHEPLSGYQSGWFFLFYDFFILILAYFIRSGNNSI